MGITQECVSGAAYVSFYVSENGQIDTNSIKVIRNKSVPGDYLKAAIEAIKGLGKFEPAKMNGKPLRVKSCLPIIYPVPLEHLKSGE